MTGWQYSDYSGINPKAQMHFPFTNPREGQLETVSEILEAIESGYKYIVLEAGTGTGKSAIAATLASICESSYILTITKQLQDQYLRDFNNLQVVKGRQNFNCLKYKNALVPKPCSEGKCITEGHDCRYSLKNRTNEITKDNTCPYYYQKYLALNARSVISNYPYLFLELNYVKDFQKRDLLICDEAHNLESMLMDQLTLEFSKEDLKEYLDFDLTEEMIEELNLQNYSHWMRFIDKIQNEYTEELDKLESLQNEELAEKIAFIKHQINDCKRFTDHMVIDPKTWIFDFDDSSEIAQFKPLKVNSYAKDTLFKYADVVLFMSATILDCNLFAEWLGISHDEIYQIRRKSPFDIQRNQIFAHEGYNLSRNFISANAPKTIGPIDEILEKHKNEKGIIHTVSSKCMNYLIDKLDNSRLIGHDSKNRAEQLETFIKSEEPLVLVSPSMGEGVDLPDDLCRFQIMYKIPYPDWGDKQVNQRTVIDPEWYDYKTCLNMVQTHGRGMRDENDYCRTYVIDSRFKSYIRTNPANRFLPDTFKEAIEDYCADNTEKQRLIELGNSYLNDRDYEKAFYFFRRLLKNDLFINDDYPYLNLSKVYHEAELYEQEVQIIMRFLNSGIESKHLDYFKERLNELAEMGYL
ncbi:helicase C-terminal domain-containing protein [Methanobrevibacter sp. YE315]|uniref:helicase C-terminal domain-containing protein n=1 Tax=Methanobrevibacter sp. YE315 TaxID=1609968 RepID=UPI00082EC139|nr:ATP-dependent DNA helicase [Methanobrevibacter sp. YE315]